MQWLCQNVESTNCEQKKVSCSVAVIDFLTLFIKYLARTNRQKTSVLSVYLLVITQFQKSVVQVLGVKFYHVKLMKGLNGIKTNL